MNISKKCSAFFALARKSNSGFTLVELIIVIAILAILGGISVPLYNGYILKANDAADQQLLAAVNTAFASACMEGKVDVENVTEASIFLDDQKVYGLSTITATETETSAAADINVIAPAFTRYYEGNQDVVFKKENVNSLVWNDAADSFELSEAYTSMRITLSSGKTLVISAEDMEMIMASTYADMGAAEVTAAINNVGKSGETLAGLIDIVDMFGVLGLKDKMSNVFLYSGLVDSVQEGNDLSTTQKGNALQMVTAKYFAEADQDDIDYLLNNVQLTDSTSMLTGLTGDAGGTRTVAAAALQYALVEAYANSDAANGQTITYNKQVWNPDKGLFGGYDDVPTTVTVSEYLSTKEAIDDPIKALATVQASAGYSNYATTEQYQKDVDGFVGTMSILGDNIGTTTNPGSISIEDYFNNGVNSSDAQDALTAVLGA